MTQPNLFAQPPVLSQPEPSRAFNGPTYEAEHDNARLTGQIQRVYELVKDGRWRTLEEIASSTGDPHASVSAQLRHLRKQKFGGYRIDRRVRGERSRGLYEYRLVAA